MPQLSMAHLHAGDVLDETFLTAMAGGQRQGLEPARSTLTEDRPLLPATL